MQQISHQKAQRWLHLSPDLDTNQQMALQTHLETCVDCRTYAGFIGKLAVGLPAAIAYPYLPPGEETRRQAAILEKVARRSSSQRLRVWAREISWVAMAAALILVFSWILKVNVPRATPAQVVEVTPTPESTATPIGRLNADSQPAEVRLRIMNPSWAVLTISGYSRQTLSSGEQVDQYVQAWLDRSGAGRALVSSQLPAGAGLSLDTGVDQVWASDGQQTVNYAPVSGATTSVPGTSYYHPLEGVDPVLATILPGMFASISSEVRIVEETALDGRSVLVVDWAANRLWVDTVTGLILRRQTTDENGQPFETRLTQVDDSSGLPGWIAQIDGLEGVSFALPGGSPGGLPGTATPTPETPPSLEPPTPVQPSETPLPSFTPQPIEPPVVQSNNLILTINSQGTEPATDSQGLQAGELYFIQREIGEPFSRVLTRSTLDCLQSNLACPAEVVPGIGAMGDAPVFWSPDGSQAIWIDRSANRLALYNRPTGEWRTLLDNALTGMDIAAWSPDSASFVVTMQGEDAQTSLATVVRVDGASGHALAPGLGGLQIPLGWPDAVSFLVLVDRPIAKGTDGLPTDPVMVRINLEDGTWTEIPAQAGSAWLNSYPALSPDGQRLVLQLPVDGSLQLAVMSLDGQQVLPLGVNGVMPAWSPDGQKVSFITTQEGSSVVYIMNADGSGLQQVFDWPAFPSVLWMPDSQHLVVQAWPAPGARPDSDRSALYLVSLAGGEPLRLTLAERDEIVELVFPAARLPSLP
jgi:hypothetical protein